MKIIRAFQIINQDGTEVVSATYNEINDDGEIEKRNEKYSFYAVDDDLKKNISAMETYIENRLDEE